MMPVIIDRLMARKYGDDVGTTPMRDPPRPSEQMMLNVLGEGLFASHPLPAQGVATIGRGQNVTIVIDDPSISRRHAVLHIGPGVMIEDCGSVNGTRVGGQLLAAGERRPIALGEAIEVGSVTVAVVGARAPGVRPRRLLSHDFFESRLEDQCARAERTQRPFSVVRLSASDDPAVHQALAEALEAQHPVAAYGPGEYEALLVGLDGDAAAAEVKRVAEALAMRGLPLKSGIAAFPRDGRTPEALVAHACRQLRPVRDTPANATPGVVVIDPNMVRLHQLAERVAAGNISVLLLGETGSGKEILAETIHARSPRSGRPFLRLNCAALAENLLESELFGHEKGSFSGATQTKPGLLETAEGGTIFLDEVGEMPLSLQAKLLRVIEERMVMRVGGLKARPINVRFVSATNRDLEQESARGTFRQDLYYRLNGMSLVIPPLRERPSEIEALAKIFVARAAAELGRPAPRLGAEVPALLRRYIWPGNIRELRNVMERAVLLCLDGEIALEHMPVEKMTGAFAGTMSGPRATVPAPAARMPLGDESDQERQRIVAALEACGGNQTHAARLLGIARGTLVARLAEYNLPRPRKR
jgi:DNA-binding NtrC family response regulator